MQELPVISEHYLNSLSSKKKLNRIKTTVFDLEFDSPLGVAAGFDKNAELAPTLQALGFGFLELGSVTNQASKGNPRPRLFRLPEDEAIINRLGLNNNGPLAFAKRLEGYSLNLPVAINIAKTHSEDILGDAAIEDIVSCYKPVSYTHLTLPTKA